MTSRNRLAQPDWPALTYSEWSDTVATLHMWAQIVGKIRLAHTPWTNHSWHVPLYLTGRGLSTSVIPYRGAAFEISFDFVDHQLIIQTVNGAQRFIPLEPVSVAEFYRAILEHLDALNLSTSIRTTPSEIADGIPFDEDAKHQSYDRAFVSRFWHALIQIDRVFKVFRSRFIGKCSPVHFFWGSFDLAVTRFSGKVAPPHPGGIPNLPDWVAREAYSHEVSSAGFWPGGGGVDYAAFYSYAYPSPDGFSNAKVVPSGTAWSADLGEFLLPYDEVQTSSAPDDTLLDFLQSTYEAAADLAHWDRPALERNFEQARSGIEDVASCA